MSQPLARERAVAIQAVVAASRVCLEVQARLVQGGTLQKGDKSPVTVADFAAQAIVSHLLARSFPADPLVGEEDAQALREPGNEALRAKVVAAVQAVLPELGEAEILGAIDRGVHAGGPSGRHWTLDPIDGTKGFLRMEQYAVALALIEDGQVVLGVLGCPALPVQPGQQPAPDAAVGVLFTAVKGQGATQRALDDETETAISVSTEADPTAARFCESVEKEHSNQSHSARVAALLGISLPPFRIDSQCKYAAVARGDASIYLRLPTIQGYEEKIWDHAAGVAVIQEAGGCVTDVTGRPLDFSLGRTLSANQGVVVTNGRFHDRVVSAVREVLEV